jgi:hypothetical protein
MGPQRGKIPLSPDEHNWKDVAKDFHSRNNWAKFTMDFNSSMEGIMADRTAAPRERVLAWIKRYSWGHYSDFAVDRIGGRALRQKDCAAQLGLGRPEISRAVAHLVRSGLVQVEQDNLYPVRNPKASMLKRGDGRGSGRWKRFFDELSTADPEEARLYRELEKQFNAVKKRIMRRYREWGKPAKSGDDIANSQLEESTTQVAYSNNYSTEPVDDSFYAELRESSIIEKTQDADSSMVAGFSSPPSLTPNYECPPSSSVPQTPTTTTSGEKDTEATEVAAIRTYLSQNGVSSDFEIVSDLLHKCRANSPYCSVEEIISELAAKLAGARQADHPMAWLRKSVPKCFVGGKVIPIPPVACPMPECIELRVHELNKLGQCVRCGLTREIAQQRSAAANDPALKALIAMRGGQS